MTTRYSILLFVLLLAGCGGDSSGPLDNEPTKRVSWITSVPASETQTIYDAVRSCTGIPMPDPDLTHVVTLDSYWVEDINGIGVELSRSDGRIYVENRQPDDLSDQEHRAAMLAAIRHITIHYAMWWSDELDEHEIGHTHDYFVTCS